MKLGSQLRGGRGPFDKGLQTLQLRWKVIGPDPICFEGSIDGLEFALGLDLASEVGLPAAQSDDGSPEDQADDNRERNRQVAEDHPRECQALASQRPATPADLAQRDMTHDDGGQSGEKT